MTSGETAILLFSFNGATSCWTWRASERHAARRLSAALQWGHVLLDVESRSPTG